MDPLVLIEVNGTAFTHWSLALLAWRHWRLVRVAILYLWQPDTRPEGV